jgi:signal transduction histidine kinase
MMGERIRVQKNYIQEIIEYSRNSKSEVRIEKIDLQKMIDEIIDSLKYSVDAVKIEFKKRIDAETTLVCDRLCLWVALNNLIGNAIKYHDLNKDLPFIEIGYSNSRHAIYVLDNGAGILPEHQKKIFDMFYRGSTKSGGSGLGLFIIKEAVEKINGRIEVDSIHGEGSKFEIFLDSKNSRSLKTQLYEEVEPAPTLDQPPVEPVH